MIREVRRYQQEEKEIAAEEEEEDQVAQGVGAAAADDDEEEDPYHLHHHHHHHHHQHQHHPLASVEESISVVVLPVAPSGGDSVDDSERVSYAAASRWTTAGGVKHSLSSVTDPGFVVGGDSTSSSRPLSDSERKWRMQTKRRRSFSADALCETAGHQQRRRHCQGH